MSDVEPEGDTSAEVWKVEEVPLPDALGGTPAEVEERKRAAERAVEEAGA